MTSGVFFFTALCGTNAARQFRSGFANTLQILLGIVVGYNTTPIQKGYNMFALNFKQVGAKDEIDIQELFKGTGDVTTTPFLAGGIDSADNIMVWSNDGKGDGMYATYYLYDTTSTKSQYTKKRGFWVDDGGNKATKKFKNGDSLWFRRRGAETINFQTSGEVELCAISNITIQTGYNMIGSFFPDGWKLNDAYYSPEYWQKSGAASGGIDSADNIMVWTNDGKGDGMYATYYLYDTTSTKSQYTKKRYHWVNDAGNIESNAVMTTGKGAWYRHRGTGFTLEIKNQFKK